MGASGCCAAPRHPACWLWSSSLALLSCPSTRLAILHCLPRRTCSPPHHSPTPAPSPPAASQVRATEIELHGTGGSLPYGLCVWSTGVGAWFLWPCQCFWGLVLRPASAAFDASSSTDCRPWLPTAHLAQALVY